MDNIILTKILNSIEDKEEFQAQLRIYIAKSNLTGDKVDTELLKKVDAMLSDKPQRKKIVRNRHGKVTTFYL